MLEYKITKIIEAGLYTQDGEKIIDFTDVCIPLLLGETLRAHKKKEKEKEKEKEEKSN